MFKFLIIFSSVLIASQLTGCEKSPSSMCEDLFNKTLEVGAANGGNEVQLKQFKEMKSVWVDGCAKQSIDVIKAAHNIINEK